MAEHDEYLYLISARLDEALSPEEEQKLEAHLAVCPDCRRAEQELLELQKSLRSLPRLTPPDGFQNRVLSAVQAQGIPSRPKRWTAAQKRGWLAVAAAVALILGGHTVFRQTRGGNDAFPKAVSMGNANPAESAETGVEEKGSVGGGGGASGGADVSDYSAFDQWNARTSEDAPLQDAPLQAAVPFTNSGDTDVGNDKKVSGDSISGAVSSTSPAAGSGSTDTTNAVTSGASSFDAASLPQATSLPSSDKLSLPESVPVSPSDELTPMQALQRVSERVNRENTDSVSTVYDEETVSCRNTRSDTDTVVNTVRYLGLSEDGQYYRFYVESPDPSDVWEYVVSLDGSELRAAAVPPDAVPTE